MNPVTTLVQIKLSWTAAGLQTLPTDTHKPNKHTSLTQGNSWQCRGQKHGLLLATPFERWGRLQPNWSAVTASTLLTPV